MRLILQICFCLACENCFFGLNVLDYFWISIFYLGRRVKNGLPVTFELYAWWKWNLARFEINLCSGGTNNSFLKWQINFADVSKNYVYCENTLNFHIVVFSFDYIAVMTIELQIIIQSLHMCTWAFLKLFFSADVS